jgi:hypothetical protein
MPHPAEVTDEVMVVSDATQTNLPVILNGAKNPVGFAHRFTGS